MTRNCDGSRVGYGVPPDSGKFRKGESGNPGGRHKGFRDRRLIVADVANEQHEIIDNGRKRRLTAYELAILFVRNQALGGSIRAGRFYEHLLRTCQPQSTGERGGFLLIPETLESDEELERQIAEQQRPFRDGSFYESRTRQRDDETS